MGYDKDFYENNRGRHAHYAADYRDQLKEQMVEAYGGKCKHCEETDPVVLCLDHINDDAHIEKEQYGANARGGHKIYAVLKKQNWPQERFQLLCFNCNAKKEHNRRRMLMLEVRGERPEATAESRSLAQANAVTSVNNKSGFKGIFWNTRKGCWHAKIMVNYKQKHVGFFDDLTEAAKSHRAASISFWGDKVETLTDEEIDEVVARILQPSAESFNPEDIGL